MSSDALKFFYLNKQATTSSCDQVPSKTYKKISNNNENSSTMLTDSFLFSLKFCLFFQSGLNSAICGRNTSKINLPI